jgi:anti-sigma regulatory factor (Ser/Thr protein kinase)
VAVELTLANRLSELPRLTGGIDAFVRAHRLVPSVSRALHLALLEHVTNVVEHGGDAGGEVRVRLWLEPGEGSAPGMVRAEVVDGGQAYNPLEHPEVDVTLPIEARPVGGLGIHLMRRLMDELEYRREGVGNVLRMGKRLGSAGAV